MAKQTINQGTAPTGAGGDTFRTGSAKLQANDDEIYNQLGANAQGVLPAALPVNKGGTGASTAAQARTNLGLGTAASKNHGTNAGELLEVGAFGVGSSIRLNREVIVSDSDSITLPGKTTAPLTLRANANDILAIAGTDATSTVTHSIARFKRVGNTWTVQYLIGPTTEPLTNIPFFLVENGVPCVRNAHESPYVFITMMYTAVKSLPASFYPFEYVATLVSSVKNFRPDLTIAQLPNTVIDGENRILKSSIALGTAATATLTTTNRDTTNGRVLKVGDFGIGNMVTVETDVDISGLKSGFYNLGATANSFGSYSSIINSEYSVSYGFQMGVGPYTTSVSGRNIKFRIKDGVNTWSPVYTMYSTKNTTVDANGFIKAASPIVELYADRIVLNDEAQQQEITFEKLGVGDYLIKGSSGFAQEGWYVEQPKDANGNIYHAVVYEQLENGDISVKTYEKRITETGLIAADPNKPIDIKENRFISIRLQELPTEEIEPEVDQTILDDEGQPAPSHYHTLDNGVWVISGEDAERLEQEQLAKMQPLTRRQFRLALAMNGYDLSQVEALIDQIPDPMQRQIALIEWQDATTFERLNPSLLAMADLMGLSAEQVNMLWSQALTL